MNKTTKSNDINKHYLSFLAVGNNLPSFGVTATSDISYLKEALESAYPLTALWSTTGKVPPAWFPTEHTICVLLTVASVHFTLSISTEVSSKTDPNPDPVMVIFVPLKPAR